MIRYFIIRRFPAPVRLSESRLKVLGYDKITKQNIKTAMLNSDKDTMANFCKTLLELSLIEDNKK